MPMDFAAAQQYVQQQQAEQAASGRRDIENYTYRQGANRGRLLPPSPNSGQLATLVWHHTKCPPGKKHFWCWENMFPGRGIICPICQVCRELRKRGLEPWHQEAWVSPKTNWIDRMPVDPATNLPLPLDRHPGPQVIDLPEHIFNYLMTTAVNTGCDLTSLELGYDIIINFDKTPNLKKKDAYSCTIVPGAPTPLHPDPNVAKEWISKCFDLSHIHKLPDFNKDDQKQKWAEMVASANEIGRFYMNPQQAGVAGMPQQVPNSPQFAQPSYQQAPQPQFAQPGMMGAPGALPFGAPPPMAPPPQFQQPQPPQAPPPPPMGMPPMPPPPSFSGPTGPQPPQAQPMPAPPAPPQAGPQPPHMPNGGHAPWEMPPQSPAAQAPPSMGALPQPPGPPQLPGPPEGLASAPRSTWTQPQPQAPPAAPTGPSMTSASPDAKPPCFTHSRLDVSVEFGANGQGQPVKGGYSEDPQEVGYRCLMCPVQLECADKAKATYPEDYKKEEVEVNGKKVSKYVKPKPGVGAAA